ncbi:MAG: DNA-binding transcriptional regulator [Sedimentisphaerales bacterium]|nr:DNA-binding transcriptional regulator [Sedimentisphaerales bacterium]
MPNPRVLLLLEASREYGRGLLRGIAKYSSLYGQWTMEREIPFYLNRDEPGQKVRSPSKWLADGIIARDSREIRRVLAASVPIPVIFASYLDEKVQNISRLLTDDRAIATKGALHFLERGFRSFGYTGYDNMYWSRNRGVYFREEIERHGFQMHGFKQSSKKADRRWAQEQFLLADWLKALRKPCAIFCCNDDRAQQVLEACRLAALRVPENVAVLGVDNDDIICNLADPPLSSIALNLENAGFQAAQLLDHMMSGKQTESQTIVVEPRTVVTRQSSDISAIEDEDVAEAVSYIRRHCNETIQVGDVLQAVSVSRRSLYDKFKRELQCGIYTFIKNRRIEQIERLLAETDTPIFKIALELGFTSADHIAQYFRSAKGINPLQFRKQFGMNVPDR